MFKRNAAHIGFGLLVLSGTACTPVTAFTTPLTQIDAPAADTGKVLRSLQPALAVRATGCLMCHASVKSNMITDFGLGDSYFLDPGASAKADGSYYYNHGFASWQSGTVEKSLIVPKFMMNRTANNRQMNSVDPSSLLTEIPFADFLQKEVVADLDANRFGSSMGSMTANVNKVIEKKSIYIGAPTVEEIAGLAPNLSGESAFGIAKNAAAGSKISGLSTVGGATPYTTNTGKLVCNGDIVVRGILFLNAPTLAAGTQSCRIYVTGSVFLQGAVTYEGGASELANLQISSAKAILVGFNRDTLANRLCLPGTPNAVFTLPYAFTRGPGTTEEKRRSISNDSARIVGMIDGGVDGSGGNHHPRYERMLFNAPEVHSRYSSHFTGAVIAEITLFRIAAFDFGFDSVFEKVDVLPILPRAVLSITD
ncbi:MAG: hypothetical protein H7301_08455 [Cryobacterium sp.]|nr:hypothetical protein [Oligoflexia bacterium]